MYFMKKILMIASLIGLVFISCKKESDKLATLTGKWNWLSSSGGIADMTYTPKSTGVKKVIEFSTDSTFRLFRNDTLLVESKYHVVKAKSIYSQDSTLLIIYDNYPINQTYSFKSPDILNINDECYDCFENTFNRIE